MRAIPAFLLLAVSFSSVVCGVQAQSPRLFIEVSIDVSTDVSTTVGISGRVLDGVGNNVSQASISIQVNDPLGSTVHIARMLSGSDGRFSDTFGLNPRSSTGNYTVYFRAKKEGYIDGEYKAIFRVGGDFAITITQASEVVKQGKNATFNLNLIGVGGFNQTVHFTLGSALPKGVNGSFSVEDIRPNATLSLELSSSTDAPPGNYTLLVLAYGDNRMRSAGASFTVTAPKPNFIETIWPILAIGATLAIVSYLVLRNRFGRVMIPYDEEVREEDLEARRDLVQLEELRATDKIDEKEYLQRRRHLEKRLRSK